MNFAESYTEISKKVKAACAKAGRSADSAHILAVSKTQPIDAIEQAYASGVRHFGENYVQELTEKNQALSHLKDIHWHLIGPLQSNKAALAVKYCSTFHALDSEKLAITLSKKAEELEKKLTVFIQVNIDDQPTKSGVARDQVESLCLAVLKCPALSLAGLMCIPEHKDNPQQMRPIFQQMRILSEQLQRKLSLKHSLQLSMGMSEDFEVAIEEGASWVRIGRALFGQRRKKN